MDDDAEFMRRMDLWPKGQRSGRTGFIGLKHRETGRLGVLARSPMMRGKYTVFLVDVPTFIAAPPNAVFESKVYDAPEGIIADGWVVD